MSQGHHRSVIPESTNNSQQHHGVGTRSQTVDRKGNTNTNDTTSTNKPHRTSKTGVNVPSASGASSSSSSRARSHARGQQAADPNDLLPKEQEVLLHNSADFANSLHLDDDDINLYLVAEMLREQKRRKVITPEVSYREPYAIQSVSTSPKSQSLQSKFGHHSSAASAPSYSNHSHVQQQQQHQHQPQPASLTPAALSLQLKSRSHRSSYASATSAALVAAAVATASAPGTLSASSACSSVSATSPAGSSLQARKRARSKSREHSKQATEMLLSNEMERFAIGAQHQQQHHVPAMHQHHHHHQSHSAHHYHQKHHPPKIHTSSSTDEVSMEDIVVGVTSSSSNHNQYGHQHHHHPHHHAHASSSEVVSPALSKDVEMDSHDSSDEIHAVQFHEDSGSGAASMPSSPGVQTKQLGPSGQQMQLDQQQHIPSAATFSSSSHLQRPPTFSGLSAVQLARTLSFLSLADKALIMSACTRIRDAILIIPGPTESISAWSSSSWRAGGGKNASLVLQKLHQTYGVQQEHATWIIPANPPQSFLLKHLHQLDFSPVEEGPDGTVEGAHQQQHHQSHVNTLTDGHFVLLPYFAALQVLDMSYLGSTPPGTATPGFTLSAITLARIALLPQLHTLILDHCTSLVDDLSVACLRNKDHTAQMSVPREEFRFLPPVMNLPALTNLSMEFCSNLTTRGLEYLVAGGGVPNLRRLNLSNCSRALSTESAAALRWNAPQLTELNLAWCGAAVGSNGQNATDPNGALIPAPSGESLRPLFLLASLTSLDLRGWTCLSPALLASLCRPSNFIYGPTLRVLSLRECTGFSNSATSLPSGVPTGLSSLSGISSLVTLDLSDCRGLSDTCLAAFGAGLKGLRDLVLWNANQLTDRGVEGLLYGSGWNNGGSHPPHQPQSHPTQLYQTLRSFRLTSNNMLTPRSCVLLATCQQMQELELSDVTGLGDAGFSALVGGAAQGGAPSPICSSLTTLHASRLGPWFTSASATFLARLTQLRTLDVSLNDGVDDTAVWAVLGAMERLTSMNLARCGITDQSLGYIRQHLHRPIFTIKGGIFSIDVRYCAHLSPIGVRDLRRDGGTRVKVQENLSEYAQTTRIELPQQQQQQQRLLPQNQHQQNNLTPPRSGSNSLSHDPHTPSPVSGAGCWGFRIEDQVVPNEDDPEDDLDDGEDDEEDDGDDEMEDDASMSGEPKRTIPVDHVEQDETGQSWDVMS